MLRAKDPDLLNLRKAVRATLVSVPLLALLKVGLDQGPLATFAFFACFVALVFANFGGPSKSRALAYVAMIILGNVVIVVGSLLSETLLGGTAAMFAIIFAASFAAVFGGHAPAFLAPIALAYSLAVLDPLSSLAIDIRVWGWTIGGVAATVAALVMWPVDLRARLRHTLADASDGFATALAQINDKEASEAGYSQAIEALAIARAKTSAPQRPAGPMTREIGLLHLVEHLEQVEDMVRRVLDGQWDAHGNKDIIAASAAALRQTSAMLRDEVDPASAAIELSRLDAALLARRRTTNAALTNMAGSTAEGGEHQGAEGLAKMRQAFPVLALSHIVMWVIASTARGQGAPEVVTASEAMPEIQPVSDRPKAVLGRIREIAMRGLDPDGVIFRNSIRAAAAMSLAVVLAWFLPVEHGFWVTLAALLVLRSSATETSATVFQAMAGTLAGFVVGAIVLKLFGTDSTALWILLPICVFLSSYTPGVVSFVVGQVSFTALVVVLFTIIDPEGYTTDVMRVETVALGAVSGAVMGFILWPHGARAALARAVAVVYRDAGEAMRNLMTSSPEELLEIKSKLYRVRRHADEAFGIALNERGQSINARAWVALFKTPNMVHSLVVGVVPIPSSWIDEHCAGAKAATIEHRNRVAARLDAVAEQLDPKGADVSQKGEAGLSDDLIATLMDCLDTARPLGIDRVADARLLTAWNEWFAFVDESAVATQPELDRVVAASRPRAWLRWSAHTSRSRFD